MCKLKPLIQKGVRNKILFIGMNPAVRSCENGVYFSSNRSFWIQLHKAGLTDEVIVPKPTKTRPITKGDDKKLFDYKFGITDLLHTAGKLSPRELEKLFNSKERKRLRKEISDANPEIICFIGKTSYRIYIGIGRREKVKYAPQKSVNGRSVFVMYFPTDRTVNTNGKVRLLKKLEKACSKK